MFSDAITRALIEAANSAGLEPAACLALVEVETSGKPFEDDGRTPALLYERHQAWKWAGKVSKALQSAFARAALAIPVWSPKTQYKDQGTSSKRLALIGRARAIDAEVANRSASWGLGQTMGFLYSDLGFASACAMVAHMDGSITGQIDCMLRELRNRHLIDALNRHEWARVALVYNGKGYKANNYDNRLADAYKRWVRRLATMADGKALAQPDLAIEQIKLYQKQLRKAGFPSVGKPDGHIGKDTIGAIAAFQAHQGLPVSSTFDAATIKALAEAEVPAEVAPERKRATADDLREAGSKTLAATGTAKLLSKAKVALGTALVGGGEAAHEGLLDTAQGGIDKINQAKGIWDSVKDLLAPIFSNPAPAIIAGAVLIGAGVAIYYIVNAIEAHRVADHNSGVHRGPAEE